MAATTSGGGRRSRGGGGRLSSSKTTPAHVIDATAIGFDDDATNVAQPPTSSSSRGRRRNSNTTTKAAASAKRKSRGEGHHDKTTMEEEEMDEDEEDDDDDDEDALTLGDRVRALEVSVNGATTSAEKTLGAGDGKNEETTTAAPTFVPPKADSLATLLAQALAADDVQLLERCLSVHDKRAIETTVGRLSGPLAMKLLSICIDNMKDKPNRGERLAKWCRATLVRHAGFASVSPNAQKTLTHLQAQIDARTAQREPLLQLMGRLDLLLYASSRDEVQDACENARLNEDERGIPAAEYHEAVDVLDDLVVGGGEGESEEDFDDDDNSEGEEWETDDGEDDDDDDEEMDSEDEEDPFAKSDRHEDLEDEEDEEDEDDDD